ncbi:hypothetical protein G5I_11944 [Acromyrmex echinatior]|uniref:Double jelly roll-like domain-containing protein n=1 Tax=Acromyrmex echinatior TaxID=103372 RepID=F4X0Z1_ACREC|nr:hypothetical protein G5I_11944 [Acromyrmex echinatior]
MPMTLINNCVAFMFDEIRYELNGVEIDHNRNVGIRTVPYNDAKRLITMAVFEDDAVVYVKGRKKRTWLWNLLLDDKRERITEHHAVRLLSRRYDLTNTGYKFLEIGINVGPPSYVGVALGDHRGHELSLSLETWKSLYEQRGNIYKMFRNEYKDNFISIGPLTVSVCMLNDTTLVHLDSSSVRITMTDATPYV